MRYLLVVILSLTFVTSALAFENYPLSDWQDSTYREDVFTLVSYPQVEITLDCASFVHGITVKEQGSEKFLMLYQSECFAIYSSLRQWFDAKEEVCLKLDFIRKDWDLQKTTYDCR